jgi:EmrB/QacA subfamily drug resistance transporter
LILTVACGAQVMVVLDSLIVNVALPRMKAGLGLSSAGQQWLIDCYLITFGGLLLVAARMADQLGHRRVFLTGLAVFTLASLIGGLADHGWTLLMARALQGVGAAAIAPGSLSLITLTHPDVRQRTHALSVWSATSGSAGALGLVLGGVLTDTLGWRWVLFINVPIGAALFAAAACLLRPTPTAGRTAFDLRGAITMTLGTGSLVYGISQATAHGWAARPVVIALAAAAALLGLFVIVERRSRVPLIPLAMFRRRNVITANAIMALVGAVMTATLFFLSVYQQQVLGYSPLRTGLALLPMSAVVTLGAIATKMLLPRFGARTVLIGGAVTTCAGLLWMATLPVHADYASHVLGSTVLWAAGIGVMTMPVASIATTGIEPTNAGLASGLVNMSRQVGGAVGLAALTTVAATTSHGGGAHVVPGYDVALIVAAGIALITVPLTSLAPNT